MKPPPGVHWVEIYDEMEGDPDYDPHWCFDLLHPDDCRTIEEPTWGECQEHKGQAARKREEARERGDVFTVWTEVCEACTTAGPPMTSRPGCPFESDIGAIGDDAYAAGTEWPKDRSIYFHERSDLRAGTFRVTWEHDGRGEDFSSWIEIHEEVATDD